jgi:ABC-type antimicrobial peptide transport system permease subunit
MVEQIKSYEHVLGVARIGSAYVFDAITYNGKKLRVQGVNAYEPNGVIQHTMVAGRDFTMQDSTGKILITQDYANKMGFKNNYEGAVGKQVTLTTSGYFTGEGATLPDPFEQWRKCQNGGCDSSSSQQQQTPTALPATIVGVVADDSSSLFFPLDWARKLGQNRRYEMTKTDQEAFNNANNIWTRNGQRGTAPVPHFTLVVDDPILQNGYQSFVVKVDKTSNVETVAAQIRKLKVGAVTAQNYITGQLNMFKIISMVLGGVGGIALAVAAIGVINTMIMSILERTREIGVMRAVGAKRSTVSWLFTIEAALLGFWGGVFGVAFGYGLTRIANVVLNKQLSSSAGNAHNIIGLPLWLIVSVIGITTVIGLLAGLYPARRAAKLDPVEALRYE